MLIDSVVLDIDGFLADFEGAFCKKFGNAKRHIVNLTKRYPDREAEILEFVKDPATYEELPLGRQIAKWFLKKDYEICIVSSRPRVSRLPTKAWLTLNHIPFHNLYVDDAMDKTEEIGRIRPMLALDDLGSAAVKLKEMGIQTMLMHHPWNVDFRLKFPRIYDFPSFLRQFRAISSGRFYANREVPNAESRLGLS